MVGVAVSNHIDLALAAGCQRSRGARNLGVIGIHRQFQAGIVHRLDQQGQIGAPVAGDDGVCAGLLDFRYVRSKVLDLAQWMQVVSHNLHIRALAGHAFFKKLGNLLAVRIILVDQKHFFDIGLVFDKGGQAFHLHAGVCVQPEVPIAAFVVGQRRVNRCVI